MKRSIFVYVGMVAMLIMLVVISIRSGSVNMDVREIWNTIIEHNPSSTNYAIVWQIRMPRILAAVLLGGALSVSGYLLQTFFQNPIAGPYVLGVSSGAKLAVALMMIVMLNHHKSLTSLQMVGAAFVGSMVTMGLILLLSIQVRNMSMLVVCGILVGYICSAITDFCVTFASDTNIVNLHNWSQGSLSGMTMEKIRLMTAIIVVIYISILFMAKPIGAYQMGEVYAKSMGVSIRTLRIFLVVASSVLSACVTAFAGPISFVGIAVPHLAKMMLKTTKPLRMIPACILLGGIVTVFSDLVARSVFAPNELSISTVTAILLVPVVIAMMMKRAGRKA